jgi:hypothetical protein
MTISEVIKLLNDIKDEHGDIECNVRSGLDLLDPYIEVHGETKGTKLADPPYVLLNS